MRRAIAGIFVCSLSLQAQTVLAAHRGAPYVNLADGRAVTAHYGEGPDLRQARSLSLASADFDEDGAPDLAAGYAMPGGTGAIALHRGNLDALWPHGREAPPAFHPDVRVFAIPEPADFLAAGDFDADGHWDLAAASRGGQALYLLPGDGHGGFGPPRKIALAGAITAVTAGEINRRDGLTDLAVGIATSAGAQVLVFESPAGALRGTPETFAIPAPAAALLMAQLDDDQLADLAIASGRTLIVIHGRDRRLSAPHSGTVAEARITRQTFPYLLRSLAAGRFTGHRQQLALLGDDAKVHLLERAAKPASRNGPLVFRLPGGRGMTATQAVPDEPGLSGTAEWLLRDETSLPANGSGLQTAHVSSSSPNDLLVTDAGHIHVLCNMRLAASLDLEGGSAAAVLPMRLNRHPLSSLVVLHSERPEPLVAASTPPNTFTVTNTGDTGAGSLRQALKDANSATGAAEIVFNIPTTDPNYNPATGTFLIQPTNIDYDIGFPGLPDTENVITIDGYTQPGASPNSLAGGDNAVIRIEINGALAVTTPGADGLFVGPLSSGAVIRGFALTGWTTPAPQGSAVTGANGIEVEGSGVYIEGNFSGTDVTGMLAKGNLSGLFDSSGAPNVVGGTTPQARNLFSGNQNAGVAILESEFGAGEGFVMGNFMGTDVTGAGMPANSPQIEGVGSTATTTIGGTVAGAGNVISGSLDANVSLSNDNAGLVVENNLIQGNFIGVDVTGTKAVSNSQVQGIAIGTTSGSQLDNTVGGTTPAARNIISGQVGYGVSIIEGSYGNVIQGNYIGTDGTGTVAIGNGLDGVFVGPTAIENGAGGPSTIGGEATGAGNVISGNADNGVEIAGDAYIAGVLPTGVVIQGNLIGSDASGVNPIGNRFAGILAGPDATNTLIGGPNPGAGNIIAFNGSHGVWIITGAPIGGSDAQNNQVTGNTIFSNDGAGVRVTTGFQDPISANSIYLNNQLGIDLDTAGPDSNSSCQSNNSGANNLQNAPVLTAASGPVFLTATATDPKGNTSEFSNCVTASGGLLNLAGTFNGLARTTFRIEFFTNDACDPSGFGQGKTYIGATSVTTGSDCNAAISGSIDLTKADVSVTLSGPRTWSVQSYGYTGTYTAVVTNNGALTAHNVTLTDNLPSALSLASISPTAGTCSNSGNNLTCGLGTLAAGQSATITVMANAVATGTIANTVTVSATEADPNTANNSATASTSSTNPFPAVDHSDPPSVQAGSPTITLNLYGIGFNSATTATFNGTPLQVTGNQIVLINQLFGPCFPIDGTFCNQLTVTVPAALLATAGNNTITVTNPAPGGGTSNFSFPVVGGCTFTVSPNTLQTLPNYGGVVSITVTPSSETCPWSAVSNVVWLTNEYASETNNVGTGYLSFDAAINTGATLNGSLTVAGQTIPVQEAGGLPCNFAVAPFSESFTAAGGTGSFGLSPQPYNGFSAGISQCPWTAASSAPWLTLTTTRSGAGNGIVGYAVAANTGGNRIGTISAGGVTFTVSQSGVPGPCDVNNDGKVNIADAQRMINEALGAFAVRNDLNHDGIADVVDIQIVIDAALNLGCSAS